MTGLLLLVFIVSTTALLATKWLKVYTAKTDAEIRGKDADTESTKAYLLKYKRDNQLP